MVVLRSFLLFVALECLCLGLPAAASISFHASDASNGTVAPLGPPSGSGSGSSSGSASDTPTPGRRFTPVPTTAPGFWPSVPPTPPPPTRRPPTTKKPRTEAIPPRRLGSVRVASPALLSDSSSGSSAPTSPLAVGVFTSAMVNAPLRLLASGTAILGKCKSQVPSGKWLYARDTGFVLESGIVAGLLAPCLPSRDARFEYVVRLSRDTLVFVTNGPRNATFTRRG